jgi:hypothetical protein
MKTKSLAIFILLLGVAFAQNGTEAQRSKNDETRIRISQIQLCLSELARQSLTDNMPGTGKTIEQKLVRLLAEEVISLREDNDFLRSAMAAKTFDKTALPFSDAPIP